MTLSSGMNISKDNSWQIFDDIYERYDMVNIVLSFGIHRAWRKKFASFLPRESNIRVLDIATGTAEMLLLFRKNNPSVRLYGIDRSYGMLVKAGEKFRNVQKAEKPVLVISDAAALPFPGGFFDCVSIAFGIRNTVDPLAVLREIKRVLYKGAKILILELSMPSNGVLAALHFFYLHFIMPIVGFLFSGRYAPYKYLADTIKDFPAGDDFCSIMRQAGFSDIKEAPLCFGTARIYTGKA